METLSQSMVVAFVDDVVEVALVVVDADEVEVVVVLVEEN